MSIQFEYPLLDLEPFCFSESEKNKILLKLLNNLTKHHIKNCDNYANILKVISSRKNNSDAIENVPFIPVQLFKEINLLSINKEDIFKTMTSSGTSGQSLSKIFLDKFTASYQSKILSKIIKKILGSKRLPLLIIDSSAVVKDRKSFSARGAGILGFSMFGKDVTYALDENMNLKVDLVNQFLEKHKNEKIFLFGFTYMIWEYFVNYLKNNNLNFKNINGVLLHGGGWKKLANLKVDNKTFKSEIKKYTSISEVINYYGMVEQTGSIFIECEQGFFHPPIYSDIIIRKYSDFSKADIGEKGIIQLLSIAPKSYPGHSLLTSDEGVICGIDDCKCGKKGKYFLVNGRVPEAEKRGCSDTYE